MITSYAEVYTVKMYIYDISLLSFETVFRPLIHKHDIPLFVSDKKKTFFCNLIFRVFVSGDTILHTNYSGQLVMSGLSVVIQ